MLCLYNGVSELSLIIFFFQAEDGIRDLVRSRGLGDVYKRQLFDVSAEFKRLPRHAEVDADTINAVLEEGGKFAAEVLFPLNISGDGEGCTLDKATHQVHAPNGFKDAYTCLLYTSPSPRDRTRSRMPSSA